MSRSELTSTALKDESQLVTFSLGDEEYGFNISMVQEIIRPPKISPIPLGPNFLEGVANLRGVLLPIIDTRLKLGLPKAEETDRTRVLVVDIEGVKTGLRVDNVRNVLRYRHSDEDGSPQIVKNLGVNFVRGVVRLDGGKRIILNLDPKPLCLVDLDRKTEKVASLPDPSETTSNAAVTTDETTQIVTFLLGAEEYGFAIHEVQEILRSQPPKVVPNMPPYVKGILSVRAQVLPVIELSLLLGVQTTLSPTGEIDLGKASTFEQDQRLLVIKSGGQLLAVIVDKVLGVYTISRSKIEKPPQVGKSNGYLTGIAKLDQGKRLVLLLESQHLHQDQALQELAEQNNSKDQKNQQQVGSNTDSISATRQFITFMLATGEFGLPISQVQEIDRHSKTTKIPSSPDYMEGICSLRGEIIPVINARKRLHLEAKESDQRTRVIFLDIKGTKTGLVVDSVKEVLTLTQQDISAPPDSISSGISQHYLSGIGKVDQGKRMILLLEGEKILD